MGAVFMVFNDMMIYYNEVNENLNNFKEFNDQIINIKRLYNLSNTNFIVAISKAQINASNFNNSIQAVNKNLTDIQIESRKINPMKLGRKISALELMKTKYNNENLEVDCLIKLLFECSDALFDLSNGAVIDRGSQIIKLVTSIDEVLMKIKSLHNIFSCLTNINKDIQNNNIYADAGILSIRLYRENITTKEFGIYMGAINDIYDRVCSTLDISSSDYALRPVKIESGSLYEKIFGHPTAIKFMQDLLERAIAFVYRNFSREGKLNASSNNIDKLKEELELIDLCEKHGIKTDTAKKVMEENLNLICKDVLSLTEQNSKISINDNILDLGEETSKVMFEKYDKISLPEQTNNDSRISDVIISSNEVASTDEDNN